MVTLRPRGSGGVVSAFCAEDGISRKSFDELRKRARADGPAAVLGHGPISVHDKAVTVIKTLSTNGAFYP